MSLLTSTKERSFYKWYFIIHIPITIFIDSSVVLGDRFPVWTSLVKWHCQQNNDILLIEKPNWLWWFVLVELVFQLPLFFYFVMNWSILTQPKSQSTHTMARLLKLYGLEASLTTAICIIAIWSRNDITLLHQLQLTSVYLPTFLIPGKLLLE
ncbi:hypothetical protein MOUN0_G07206 [Monosporozyma unispora]